MAGLVPAIPIRKSTVLDIIGITGTRPVMTWESVADDLWSAALRSCYPTLNPPRNGEGSRKSSPGRHVRDGAASDLRESVGDVRQQIVAMLQAH
jgi:hypothetical protein